MLEIGIGRVKHIFEEVSLVLRAYPSDVPQYLRTMSVKLFFFENSDSDLDPRISMSLGHLLGIFFRHLLSEVTMPISLHLSLCFSLNFLSLTFSYLIRVIFCEL